MGRGRTDRGTVYGPYMDNVADFVRRANAHCIRVIVNLDGFPANLHYYTEVADRPPSPDIAEGTSGRWIPQVTTANGRMYSMRGEDRQRSLDDNMSHVANRLTDAIRRG